MGIFTRVARRGKRGAIALAAASLLLAPATARAAVAEHRVPPSAQPDLPLAGTYTLLGWNPGVSTSGPPSYRGQLVLAEREGMVAAQWVISGGQVLRGVGMLRAVNGQQVLALGFDAGGLPSCALYVIKRWNGHVTLSGEWVARGVGHELARR